MKLTIINPPVNLWDTKSNTAYPALQKYGFEKYESDTIAGQYIYVIANSDGSFKTPTIAGYTKIGEFKPGGYLPDGSFLKQPSDAGLKALSDAYNLGWYDVDGTPLEVDYATLKAYDTSTIPKEDFRIDNDQDAIKDMVSQPYEQYRTSDGEVFKVNGDNFKVIKTF